MNTENLENEPDNNVVRKDVESILRPNDPETPGPLAEVIEEPSPPKPAIPFVYDIGRPGQVGDAG